MGVDVLKQQVLNQVVAIVVFIIPYYVTGGRSYYWLASRFVATYSTLCDFGLRYVSNGNVGGVYRFSSVGDENVSDYYVHPVVSLPASLINTNSGNGLSSSTAWGVN